MASSVSEVVCEAVCPFSVCCLCHLVCCACIICVCVCVSLQPSSAQRFKALGSKARNPRDRPFVSTTQTVSRTSATVGWSGSPSPPKAGGEAFGFGSSYEGAGGVAFPPIPPAKVRVQAKGKAEWGETALRKQAGSVQITQLAKDLLK